MFQKKAAADANEDPELGAGEVSEITITNNHPEPHLIEEHCLLYGVEIRPSARPGNGDGLFTVRPFAAGEIVCHAFGSFMRRERLAEWLAALKRCNYVPWPDQDELPIGRSLPDGRILLTSQWEEMEFVEDYCRGFCRILDVCDCVQDKVGEYVLIVDRSCPLVKINDPHGGRSSPSCKIEFPRACPMAGKLVSPTAFPVVTLRALEEGTELYLDYGWTEKDWTTIIARCTTTA